MRTLHAVVKRRMKSPNDKAAIGHLAAAEAAAHKSKCPECRAEVDVDG